MRIFLLPDTGGRRVTFHIAQRHRLRPSSSPRLAMVVLFTGLGFACVDTIWSVYLDSFVHNIPLVGLLSSLLTLASIVFFFISSPLVERIPESRLWTAATLLAVTVYATLFFIGTLPLFLLVSVALVLVNVLRIESFGILVRDLTPIASINAVEGLIGALNNVGWLIGPLLAGFIATRAGYQEVFLAAALATIVAVLLFRLVPARRVNHRTDDDGTIMGSLRSAKRFLSNPLFFKCYLIRGGISIFWSFVFVYVPLFIIRSGVPAYWVGIFLCSTALPLILLDYWVGKRADIVGCKQFFLIGYGGLAILALLAFIIPQNIYAIMAVLFLASIVSACLDSTPEAYFFKVTRISEEEMYYGPFTTSGDVIGMIGRLAAAGVLLVMSQRYVFLLLAAFMLFFLLVAATIEERPVRARAL
jgi:MFS family permease